MNIKAIDGIHASVLSDVLARRHAARLSLLLDIGLYPSERTPRWTVHFPEEKDAAMWSERHPIGFTSPTSHLQEMPKKGTICPLGKYQGSLLSPRIHASSHLSLPPETREILRQVDKAPAELRDAFDNGARLWQVALVIGRYFPSARLAYRTAGIDAVSKSNGERNKLKAFFRKFVTLSHTLDKIFDHLWGSVRSGHFHGGGFPLGEFDSHPFFGMFKESEQSSDDQTHRICDQVTRQVIVGWIQQNFLVAPAPSRSPAGKP